jgi:hypothetical protein
MPIIKHTKTNQSKKSSTTTSSTQAPAPAASPVNSTAEQAPAPQTTQAPNVTPPVPATPAVTGVANNGNTGTKMELQTSYVALIAGLQTFYQPSDVLLLTTGTQTCGDLIAEFQQYVQAAENTKASYQAWRGDVQTERTVLADVGPKRSAVRSLVESRFGKGGTQLLQLGFAPKKTVKRTVVSKAEGVVKGEATRKARGTKGSKQKLEVSGNVTGVELTPITSTQNVATPANVPASAAPAAAPAAGTPAVKPAGQ